MSKVRWDRTKGRPEPIAALNRVREVECGEPLVDLRLACPELRILRDSVIPYLRQTVTERLNVAMARLPEGMYLGVIDAWRPFARQVRIYEYMVKSALEIWPDLSHAQLRRKVCRFVAPVDQKAPPGHCTGAAIDVFLVDDSGEYIDISSPFTRYEAAPTYSFGLTPESERNRMILVDAMLGAGFSNCRDEWWHYSYGDAGWAVREGLSECIYGKIELDPALYEKQEKVWMRAQRLKTNPFLELDKAK